MKDKLKELAPIVSYVANIILAAGWIATLIIYGNKIDSNGQTASSNGQKIEKINEKIDTQIGISESFLRMFENIYGKIDRNDTENNE